MKVILCVILAIIGINGSPTESKKRVHPQHLDKLLAEGRYEEFSELIGLPDSSFAKEDKLEGRAERSRQEAMYSKKLEYGDIMPMASSSKDEQGRNVIKFDQYPGSKWENHRLPYWINGDFSQEEREIIKDGIKYWNSILDKCIEITEWKEGDRDYIYIFSGSGCWSYLGRHEGGQYLSLSKNGCLHRGIVVHEIMHAAGYHHTQTRNDRDCFVDVLWHNIPESWHSQYHKTNDDHFQPALRYDYYSVMHYGLYAPETGKRAFHIKVAGIDEYRIGNGNGFTWEDVWKLAVYYC